MRAMLAVLLMVSQAAALQTRGRSALRLRGGSAEVAQQEQTNATRSDYVVKGTIGAAGTGALVWGARSALAFLGRRRAAERRRARSLAVRARRTSTRTHKVAHTRARPVVYRAPRPSSRASRPFL